MTRIDDVRTRLTRLEGRREALRDQAERLDRDVTGLEDRGETLVGCRSLLGRATARSRQEIKERVERSTTHALRAVMGDDSYRFEIAFVERRGKVEADPVLHTAMSDGDPIESNGYGVVDVVGTTLRLVIKTMLGVRGPLIMDEPAKYLDRERQPNYMRMLREFSEKTGTQIIICTHVTEHIEFADRIFEVTLVDGKSHVQQRAR